MSLALLSFLPVVAGIGFLYWADQLNEEHDILKLFFQLMFLPLLLLSINFSVIYAGLVWSGDEEFVVLLAQFSFYLGMIIYIVGAYISFVVLRKVYDMFVENKIKKDKEKHG